MMNYISTESEIIEIQTLFYKEITSYIIPITHFNELKFNEIYTNPELKIFKYNKLNSEDLGRLLLEYEIEYITKLINQQSKIIPVQMSANFVYVINTGDKKYYQLGYMNDQRIPITIEELKFMYEVYNDKTNSI